MNWYLDALKQYATFTGRARRQAYWMFFLFTVIISIVLGLVDRAIGMNLLGMIYGLATLIPGIAVGVRRLHDTDRSGWWILVGLIPFIGWLILLYFMVQDGTPGDNQYGSNPKAADAPAA